MSECEWPVSYSACGSCPSLLDLTEDERLVYEQMAADYLYAWTGRVLGLCEVTVRPFRKGCTGGNTFDGTIPTRSPWSPAFINGQWFNVSCGSCGPSSCGCAPSIAALELPGPVNEIVSVQLEGDILDPGDYRVDNGSLLVRLNGEGWPVSQDIAAPLGDDDTWGVTYKRGIPVPVGGQAAAGVLACELAKAACQDNTCRLPQRVQTVTRQGVTVAVLDSFDDIDSGHTGIWLIDSWIASMVKPRRPHTIRSVDVPRYPMRVTTWP